MRLIILPLVFFLNKDHTPFVSKIRRWYATYLKCTLLSLPPAYLNHSAAKTKLRYCFRYFVLPVPQTCPNRILPQGLYPYPSLSWMYFPHTLSSHELISLTLGIFSNASLKGFPWPLCLNSSPPHDILYPVTCLILLHVILWHFSLPNTFPIYFLGPCFSPTEYNLFKTGTLFCS